MKAKIFFISLLMAVFFLASLSYSGVKSVGWQGRVVDSGTGHPLHGNYSITYSIYPSASGGSPIWTETQSTFIDSGIAEVLLGSVTPIPDSVFNGSVRFLGVKVGSDPEMGPRSEMVSVPYASYAFAGGGWKDNGTAVILATSTDNVGIGTNAPQYKLDVNGDAHVSGLLKIGQTSLWGRGTNGNEAIGSTNLIKMIIDSDNDQTNQYFSVVRDEPPGGTPVGTELFRVQENGKVGIGAINPSWDLTFGYATTREIGVEEALMGDGTTLKIHAGDAFDDAITPHDGGDLYLHGGSPCWGGINGDVILAHTGAGTRGNVGIGTNNPTKKLDVAGTAKMTGFEMPTGASNGFVLTSNGSGVGTWAAPAAGPDQDWNYWSNSSVMYPVELTDNVGIGTTTPQSRLHIVNSTLAANETVVQVGFSSAVDLTSVKGIVAESDLMTIKGARIGVIGKSTVNVSGNQGSAEGRMGQVVGYDANGVMIGVFGSSNPSALDNNGATNTSSAVGGMFSTAPPAGMTLNATGTYKVGGVLATVGGQVDAAGSNSIVAGVIGEDNNTGSATSYAGYFTSNRTNYDATAIYGRCRPAAGSGVGGDFFGGYEGVKGSSDHIGVHGNVVNAPAGDCYGVYGWAAGSTTASIAYGVCGIANTGTGGSTSYGIYGVASADPNNCWAGYFLGNVNVGGTNNYNGTGGGQGVLRLGNALTNPTSGVANAAMFYAKDVAASSEMFVMDEAGNTTQLSPHDPETGEWIFYSKNVKTGRVVRIDMERLVREVEKVTGEKFMTESWEEGN